MTMSVSKNTASACYPQITKNTTICMKSNKQS